MKTKRFSVLQLILAVLLTAVVLTGGGLLALRAVVGQGGLALLEGLFLVHTRFVGDYDTAAVVDAGAGRDGGRTGGPVELLSDCRGI